MEQLIQWDYALFEGINSGWQHPWLDVIMPYWREKTTWIPAYLLLLVYLGWQHGKQLLFFLLLLATTVAVADQLSSELIKKSVQRTRPCREIALDQPARVLVHCGGGYSFTSSHATNHFAVAIFLMGTCGLLWGRWRWLLPLWAASIALGQVYVGVHFPLDITVGALLGCLVGFVTQYVYRQVKKWRIDSFYL